MGAVPAFLPRSSPLAGPVSPGVAGQVLVSAGDGTTYWAELDTQVSDATALGTLTGVVDPAFLLVGSAAGDAVRKLTPSGWGLSSLLASVPAGRVPFADATGAVTSNAGLGFVDATRGLSAGTLTLQPLAGSDANVFRVIHTNGQTSFACDLSSYLTRFGPSGVSVDGLIGNFTTLSGGDVRAASFNPFTITNPTLRWPSNTPDLSFVRDSAGVARIGNGNTGLGNLVLGNLTASGAGSRLLVTIPGYQSIGIGAHPVIGTTGVWGTSYGAGYFWGVLGAYNGGTVYNHGWYVDGVNGTYGTDGYDLRPSTGDWQGIRWPDGTRLWRSATNSIGVNGLTVRQPLGTVGTHEVQVSHNGSRSFIESKTGGVFIRTPGSATWGLWINSGASTVAIGAGSSSSMSTPIEINQATGAIRIISSTASFLVGSSGQYAGFRQAAGGVMSIEALNPGTSGTIRSIPLPVTVSADTNDWAPGTAMFLDVTTDATDRSITGLLAGVDGQVCEIRHVAGSGNLILVHESGSSIAANRFATETTANVVIPLRASARLRYTAGTENRWAVYPSKTCV